jgi:tape measure domain-containing protein
MARRDVDLVIKARDQAASVVDSITKALNQFIDAQRNLDTRADKTETTLTSLGSAIGKLDAALKGMDAGQKLASELKKSTDVLDRMETQLGDTQREVNDYAKRLDAATVAQEKYTGKLERNLAAQERQGVVVKKAKTDQKELTAAYEQAVSAQEKLQRRQQQLPGLIEKAGVAADKAARDFDLLSAQVAGTNDPTSKLVARLQSAEARMRETGDRLAKLRGEFGEIGSKLNAAGSAMVLFGGQAARAGQNLTKQESILNSMAQSYERIKAATSAVSQQQNKLASDLKRSQGALERQQQVLAEGRGELQKMAASTDEARAKLSQLASSGFATLTKAAADQRRVMLETKKAYIEAREESTRLGAAITKVKNPSEQMVASFREASAETVRLKAALIDQRRALTEMNSTLDRSEGNYKGLQTAQVEFLAILDRLAASLDRGAQKAREESAAIQGLKGATAGAGNNARNLTGATSGLASASSRAAASTGQLAAAYRQFYGDSRRSLSLLQRIRGEVLSLVAAYGGLYGVIETLKQTVTATQTLEAAQARLNVAFDGNQTRVAAEFDFIRRTSDRLGVSLGDLATEYSKFNIATKGTSLEGDKARRIFVQIAEAARVNRSSTEDLQGVFVALTQIVSKGAVQMEELRQQLGDRLPGAIQLMADGLGVGTAELIKMMEQGQVTEEALVSFADEVQKRFGGGLDEALIGITVALGRLKNAAFQAAATFGEGGFIAALTRFANKLTEVLRSADFEAFARRMSAALGGLLDFLGFIADNFQVVFTALVALIAFRLTPVVIALGNAFIGLTRSVTLSSAGFVALQARAAAMGVTVTRLGYAVRTLTRSFRLLLGSTGIGLAFVAISAAIALWSTEADKATEALNLHREMVDKVKNAYDKAGGAAQNWADIIKDVTLLEATANLQRLQDALEKARSEAILFPLAIENLFEGSLGGTEETRIKLRDLVNAFREGTITANELKQGIDDLAQADPSLNRDDFVVPFLEGLNAVTPFEEAVHQADLVLKALTGTAEESQKAMDELNGKTTDTGDSMADAAKRGVDKFNTAMDDLRDKVPELDGALGKLDSTLGEIETSFQAALRAANDLPDAIMRIAAAQEALALRQDAVNRAFQTFVDSEFGSFTDGTEAAAALIRQFEGFRSTPYYDVNAFRAGFGSDTVTLADGSIVKIVEGMTVSVADANRDLLRRITTEFMPIARNAVGDARFNAFTPQQQAALTSIAYNYGEIPDRIVEALRTGTNEEIAAAIRGLATDNGGINANRRNQEAALFTSGAAVETQVREAERLAELERQRSQDTADRIADNEFELEQQQRLLDGKEREAAIEEAVRQARQENPNITDAEIEKIKEQAGALYDLEKAQERAQNAGKEEAEAARDASAQVNALLEKRKALFAQLEEAQRRNDVSAQEELRAQIEAVNTELTAAIEKARAMWEAIGGPDSVAALARLDSAAIKAETLASKATTVYLQWDRVADLFVTGLASAFDNFAKAVADGENVFVAARQAFLQFAADFLLQIARMIIQQAIFNALQAAFGGTGFGALIGLGHTGGLVGSSRVGSGNSSRQISPLAFAGAMRYHSGGIVGLRPGEVPIIAKQGEEMLTRDDPRHMLNGGLSGGSGKPQINVRNINTFDAAGFLAAALDTPAGEQVLFNFVSANPERFKAVINS